MMVRWLSLDGVEFYRMDCFHKCKFLSFERGRFLQILESNIRFMLAVALFFQVWKWKNAAEHDADLAPDLIF